MIDLVSVRSPSGEIFEVSPRRAGALIKSGWTYTQTQTTIPENATFAEKLDLLDIAGLHKLAGNVLGVKLDPRWGKPRIVSELLKLKALRDKQADDYESRKRAAIAKADEEEDAEEAAKAAPNASK